LSTGTFVTQEAHIAAWHTAAGDDDLDEAVKRKKLLNSVFRQDRSPQREAAREDKPLLPRLLDNLSQAVWSSPDEGVRKELRTLKERRTAVAKLLDEVEHRAEEIERSMVETNACRDNKIKGSLLGAAWNCCGPSHEAGEVILVGDSPVGNMSKGLLALELRPKLRERIGETEQMLADREAELRVLKQELAGMRQESELIQQSGKEMFMERHRSRTGKRDNDVTKHFASAFVFSEGSILQIVFMGWKEFGQQRRLADKMLKRTGLTIAGGLGSIEASGLVFASWKTLVLEKRQARQQAQEAKREATVQRYAANFAGQSDNTLLRGSFFAWWRLSKEAALEDRLAAVQAALQKERRERHVEQEHQVPLPLAKNDKACCTLM